MYGQKRRRRAMHHTRLSPATSLSLGASSMPPVNSDRNLMEAMSQKEVGKTTVLMHNPAVTDLRACSDGDSRERKDKWYRPDHDRKTTVGEEVPMRQHLHRNQS